MKYFIMRDIVKMVICMDKAKYIIKIIIIKKSYYIKAIFIKIYQNHG